MTASIEEEQKQSVSQATENIMSVPQFYIGRSIFITGGTGFLGKESVQQFLVIYYSVLLISLKFC